jgi:hypothetical protein
VRLKYSRSNSIKRHFETQTVAAAFNRTSFLKGNRRWGTQIVINIFWFPEMIRSPAITHRNRPHTLTRFAEGAIETHNLPTIRKCVGSGFLFLLQLGGGIQAGQPRRSECAWKKFQRYCEHLNQSWCGMARPRRTFIA